MAPAQEPTISSGVAQPFWMTVSALISSPSQYLRRRGSAKARVASDGITGRIWFFATSGSPKVDSIPQTPSMTEGSTP